MTIIHIQIFHTDLPQFLAFAKLVQARISLEPNRGLLLTSKDEVSHTPPQSQNSWEHTKVSAF